MKVSRFFVSGLIVIVFVLGLKASADAVLYDRGGGLIYDDVLDITWLQDAKYANTTGYDDVLYGYDTGGYMNWDEAAAWASGLSYGGYDDWRLPTGTPACGHSYNCTSSELGYMYYTNLGNPNNAGTSLNTSFYSGGAGGELVSFTNLAWNAWWTGTEVPTDTTSAYLHSFNTGYQTLYYKTSTNQAWAVRDGDIAVVPEPISSTLFIIGGATLGLRRFWKKRKTA